MTTLVLNPTSVVSDSNPLALVVQRFDIESTRTAFEAQLLKELAPLGQSEEELREEYLERDPNLILDYKHLDTQIEWTGWKRGVQHGFELWGKK